MATFVEKDLSLPSQAGYAAFRSELHGVGVKALKTFDAGEVVFQEQPDCLMQSIPNRQLTVVCGCCSKFLSSLELQTAILEHTANRSQFVGAAEAARSVDIVNCQHNCGELYCSEKCREEHWSHKAHCLLCTGSIPDEEAGSSPLYAFKMFAVETNEIFLLVAEFLGKLCMKTDKLVKESGISKEEALKITTQPFETYVRSHWWEAAVTPQGEDPEEFKKTLKMLVNDCWELLEDVLQITEKGYDSVINADYISRTIGMYEQNNVGVRLRSPLATLVETLQPGDSRTAGLLSSTRNIVAKMEEAAWCDAEECDENDEDDEENGGSDESSDDEDGEDSPVAAAREETTSDSGVKMLGTDTSDGLLNELRAVLNDEGTDNIFQPLDGAAFYFTICRINHSCDPNVMVRYDCDPVKGLVANMHVLRHIDPDEELLQSYINQHLPYEERQKALEDYGIVCTCPRCLAKV